MGRPVTTTHIGDHNYRITALSATEGRRIYLALIKVLAPGLAKLPSLKDAANSDKLLGVVVGSLDGLDERTLDMFCDAFGKSSEVQTGENQWVTLESGAFGEWFAGRYADMTKWLIECIKANKFIDFLALK